jgi:hypothetical protein
MPGNAKLSPTVFLFLSVLCGCASTLDLGYRPEQNAKTPLSTIAPVTIRLQVDDNRAVEDRNLLGSKTKGSSIFSAPILSKTEPPLVLYDALKAELMNNGHTVIDPPGASSDVVFIVALERYWIDMIPHFWDVEVIGILNTELQFRDPKNDSILLTRPHNGTQRESRMIITEGTLQSVLDRTLVEYIRSFSRDPNILEALKKAGKHH